MSFEDHFSRQAEEYARHRPRYPGKLYDYLADLSPTREVAWDCGTGNGQVAVGLADRFKQVIATDPSHEQIKRAFPHPRVVYRVEPAEETTIASSSVDLITAGTAVHWFDFDRFYAETGRVGKVGAILAVWIYSLPDIQPDIDAWINRYYYETLAGYWPARIRYAEEGYRTLPFPFEEIDSPEFMMTTRWNLDCLIGFLTSWSATRRFIEARGRRDLEDQIKILEALWGPADDTRRIQWQLHVRIGRLEKE